MSRAGIIVDVEATGFENSDDITQLSIIEVDNNLQIVDYYNGYFNTDIQISPKVESITGVNNIKLKTLSNGMYLEDSIADFMHMFQKDLPIIGHNISFDKRMIEQNLMRTGFSLPQAETLCTMHTLTDVMKLKGKFNKPKYPKLEEAFAFVSRQTKVSRADYNKYYTDNFERPLTAHDAVYDTYLTYV